MILLFLQQVGVVAALTTSVTPSPVVAIPGNVTVTVAPIKLTATPGPQTSVIGPAQYPASLPLLLNVTPPGILGANSLTIRCPPVSVRVSGVTVQVGTVRLGVGLALVGTIGSPGQFQPLITFNTLDYTAVIRNDSLRITSYSGEQPKQCTFTVNDPGASSPPTVGLDVKVGLQSMFPGNLIFGGTITQVEASYDLKVGNKVWAVTCTGYSWLLSELYPVESYVSVSAGFVITDLLAKYAPPGFAGTGISAGVNATTVTAQFDGSLTLWQCILKIVNGIGGYGKVDDSKNVHAYLAAETDLVPDAINTSNSTALINPSFKYKTDLSQIRNRIIIKGASGGSTGIPIPATGLSFLPLSSALSFNLNTPPINSGGSATVTVPIIGTPGPMMKQAVIQYSQAVQSSLVTAVPQYIQPPVQVVVNASNISGGPFQVGTICQYGFSTLTRAGETTLGAFFNVGSSGIPNYAVVLNVNPNALFPYRVNGAYAINVYRKPVTFFGGQFQLVGQIALTMNGIASTFTDSTPDSGLGVFAPQSNSAAYSNITAVVQSNNQGGSIGLGVTLDPGASLVSPGIMTYNGNGAFWYTSNGNSLVVQGFSAGAGFPQPGTVIVSTPGLIGVVGLGGFGNLPSGLTVSSYLQADDVASQATLAGLLGNGDSGIREFAISDSSLITPAMLTARANAELAFFKNPIVSFTYATRDSKVGPGRSVSVNINGLTGSFIIQQVEISKLGTAVENNQTAAPVYSVTASSSKFTLQDLLRQLGGLLTVNGSVSV